MVIVDSYVSLPEGIWETWKIMFNDSFSETIVLVSPSQSLEFNHEKHGC